MNPVLSIVLPYYQNPGMLARHLEEWATYPADLRAQVEVLIVDDGSPQACAVDVPLPVAAALPTLRLYRVLEDIPWHQHGARNLGAHEAAGAWLYLGDIDHVLTAETAAAMVRLCNYEAIYTFGRVDAPHGTPTTKNGAAHAHSNTYLMPRKSFWTIGGYDEDLTGYGTDSFFRARLKDANVPVVHREDIRIVRFSRELIPDASTTSLPRKEGRPEGHRKQKAAIVAQKAAEGRKPTVLNFGWERIR